MSEVDAIQAFLEWQQERLLHGKANSLDDYEEWREHEDIRTRLESIKAVIDGDDDIEDAFHQIRDIIYPVVNQ